VKTEDFMCAAVNNDNVTRRVVRVTKIMASSSDDWIY
jgi:hypothetical protein